MKDLNKQIIAFALSIGSVCLVSGCKKDNLLIPIKCTKVTREAPKTTEQQPVGCITFEEAYPDASK